MAYIKDLGEIYLAKNYKRFPVAFVKGKGSRLYDEEGNEYLDFCAGIAVCALGHAHPELSQAICEQAQKLIHVSNLYWTEPQARLAQKLCENSFAERVFFANSGAEVVEAALKLARRYAWKNFGPEKYEIIALENSFHGRTYGALSATGQPVYWEGFKPLVPGFKHVPPNDISALEKAFSENTCAIIFEPIIGEGGVIPLTEEFIKASRELANKYNALLIFDEIQTGIGRTGKFFAYEWTGVKPDIMCLAKGLAGGMPLGALLATEEVMAAFEPGTHASTFGGNPVSCAAALVVLDKILEEGFLEEVVLKGKALRQKLLNLADKYSHLVSEVRGKGLMQALELKVSANPIGELLFYEKRILITVIKDRVLRFTPPLIIAYREIDALAEALDEALASIAK
ncbi:aspartate aminotransferase family protein [Thermodesulfatator autotrophicus]|uniref:Acetylornithine aminotransferase n=1 Tax=Thermodesulfatator autotrophicus TaxID=1795632 RepID=A0A177EA81_9BACT|nr:aspartate aminotransferase family protein [Thermodesulfatator autotrophicus]OAG28708.1 acetylornithine aminotransferase [Thermodesulfatator autotrophicus]